MNNVQQLQEKRRNLSDKARSILEKAITQNRALYPGEEADVESLNAKISAISRTLRMSSEFDDSMIEQANEPGGNFVSYVRALHFGGGSVERSAKWATENGIPGLARALSSSVATSGGFAVPEGFMAEAIEALRPTVAVRKLNPVVLPMPHGNINWPKVVTSSSIVYVGENAVLNATQPAFGALNLTARKMAAICPVSNNFLRYSGTGETIVKNDLIAATGVLEDYNFIRGEGTEHSPRGLRNWALAANVITANATVDIAHIDADLASMELALANANVKGLRLGWILSPRTENFLRSLRHPTSGVRAFPEMSNGALRGKPFATTTNVPVNLGTGAQTEIILADFADVVVAQYPLLIDISSGSFYTDGSGNKISAFNADQSVIRVISQADLAMRHQESVAVLTGVSY